MSAAEGVLTLTALFQDQASAGLKDFTTSLTAAVAAAQDAASRLAPFNEALGVTAADARTSAESFQPFNTTLTTVGAVSAETVGRLSPLGTAFTEIGATSRELVGGLGPLGGMFNELGAQAGAAADKMQVLPSTENEIAGTTRGLGGALAGIGGQFNIAGTDAQVAGTRIQDSQAAMNTAAEGGLNLKNTLVGLGGEYNTVTNQANATGVAHVGLGTKIGLVGGFIGGTASSVVGLITGYTGLEAGAVRVDRAHVMVAASAHTVTLATIAYNAAVAKYGPNSEEARTKLEALDVAQARYGVNLQREDLAQKQYNDRLLEFGVNAVQTISNIVMLGSTLTILKTNMGLTSLATSANTEANIANRGSMLGMVGASGPLSSAFKGVSGAEGEATIATRGFGLSFIEIVGPIVGAIALFALIETNTFGMGDAFRRTTTVIAQAIDAIVNEVHVLWNGFVEFLNNLAGFQATVHNEFIGVENAAITAFNGIMDAAVSFVNNFTSTLVSIYNFFINSVVNPIIKAWNDGMKALSQIAATGVNAIVNVFSGIFKTVLDLVVGFGQKFNATMDAIGHHDWTINLKPLTDLQAKMQETGKTGSTLGVSLTDSFAKPIPLIKQQSDNVTQLHSTHLQLVGGLENVSQAQHTFDGSMTSTNTHMAESIANVVNYYSHGQNLANLFQSNLPPPIKNFINLLMQQGGAMATSIEGMLHMGQATQTESSATDASTAAHKKHNEALSAAAAAEANYAKAISDAKAQLIDATTKEVQTTAATMQLANSSGFAAKGVADAAKAYADAEVKFQSYLGALTNSTAVMNTFQAGVVSGKAKLLEFAQQAVQTGAEDQTYGQGLTMLADKLGFMKSGLEATTQNEEDWIKAVNGGTQALESTKKAITDLVGGFYAFGDAITKTLGDAMAKGTKDYDKSLKDLATQTGISFDTLKNDMGLKIASGMSLAASELQSGLGVMVSEIKGSGRVDAQAMEENIAAMQHAIQGASPAVVAEWNKVFADMRKIASEPIPTAASIGKLQQDMKALNIPAQEQEAIFAALPAKYQGAASGMHTLSAAVQTVISGYKNIGETVNTTTGIITNSAGQVVGKMNLTTGAVQNTTTSFGQLQTAVNTASGVFTIWQSALTGVAELFNSTFKTGISDAIGYINMLIASTKAATTTMTTDIQSFVTNAFVNSLDKGASNAKTQVTNEMKTMQTTTNSTLGVLLNDIQNFVRQGFVNGLQKGADAVLSTVNNDFGAVEKNINNDITGAATDIVNQTNRMLNAVNTSFGAMLRTVNDDMNNMLNDVNNRGNAIISEFNRIGSSAASQVGRVNSLRSAIDALHDKTVTITTRFVTIGSPPSQLGFATPSINRETAAIGASGPTTQALTVNQPVVIQGGQNNNQPIIIQIDGQVLGRALRKNILGLSAGGMT